MMNASSQLVVLYDRGIHVTCCWYTINFILHRNIPRLYVLCTTGVKCCEQYIMSMIDERFYNIVGSG